MDEEIKRLEKRSKELDEKTRKLEKFIEKMMAEFEGLEKLQEIKNVPAVPVGKRITMRGGQEEDAWLSDGWYQSEKSFRWTGKGGKHATVHFRIAPKRQYKLFAEFFVPRYIAKKPVRIFANEKEVHRFVPGKESRFEKVIEIPAEIVNNDLLAVRFASALWSPKKMGVDDKRTLSLAFRHIELKG